jgi:hypothetical protein
MALQTIGTDVPTWYSVNNSLTGETIRLRPAAGGQTADSPMAFRYGHQAPTWVPPVGYAVWTIGSKSSFVTLSTAAIAALAPTNTSGAVYTFGSTGALATPAWLQDGNERTLVQQNNNVTNPQPPNGNGQTIAQLELRQGSNVVLLTKANCSDLAATLATIGAT